MFVLDHCEIMADVNQFNLKKLKTMREAVHWEIEDERRQFLHQLVSLVMNWRHPVVDLRDIFQAEEIDWLLAESVRSLDCEAQKIVEFVDRTGYRDEPELDADGKPLLRRTTALHYTVKNRQSSFVIDSLFNIYYRRDANHVDGSGLSHFHVACEYRWVNVVAEFLKLGHVNPNCIWTETGDSPLHLCLRYDIYGRVMCLLLRYGADPCLANAEGLTSLHILCKGIFDDFGLVNMFFEICDIEHLPVQVNARDNFGNTPLHLALERCHKKTAVSLLTRGADPNSVNAAGSTPLHVICLKRYDESAAKSFLEICDKRKLTVLIDAKDNLGRTPLQRAVASSLPHVVDALLNHGADLTGFVFPTECDFVGRGECPSNDILKLRRASGALIAVQHLQRRGYELDQMDVLTIVKFFDKYALFAISYNLEKPWYDDEKFASKAKEIMMKDNDSSLSLYDMMQSTPEQAPKLAYEVYFKIARDNKIRFLPGYEETCTQHLYEIMLRGFFRRWAPANLLESAFATLELGERVKREQRDASVPLREKAKRERRAVRAPPIVTMDHDTVNTLVKRKIGRFQFSQLHELRLATQP
ncbi:unnamed protein product [Trichogramma brassicae]|uniref:Uncharacterized protein n=1 Tax=Trichogramma brassicae TaxID=86971 RepID=A0A6H5IJT1_9HYME|nr:unnamed protein product [Trichogramma brassicae]